MTKYRYADISELRGLTMREVKNINDDVLRFVSNDGRVFEFFHSQDCCESVSIDSISGDLSDLVESPILLAEEVSSDGEEAKDPDDERYGSFTWTFYKFATRKGYVDVRWYGSSNGYYSESVDFREVMQ